MMSEPTMKHYDKVDILNRINVLTIAVAGCPSSKVNSYSGRTAFGAHLDASSRLISQP